MKTKRLLIATAVLGVMLASSCVRDNFNDGPMGGGSTDFRLKLTLNEMEAATVTRTPVPPTAGEEDVQDLCLLFFESSASGTGQFRDAILLTAPSGAPFQMNTDIPISFGGTSLDGQASYNILIVANGATRYFPDIESWVSTLAGKNEQQVYEESRVSITGEPNNNESSNSKAIPSDQILMTGKATYAPGQSSVTSLLLRGVSRFDVINNKRGEYTLKSTSVWNAFKTTSVFGGGVIDYSTSVERTGRYYGVASDAGADIVGGLYAFENQVASPEQSDRATTCLIVGIAPDANVDFTNPDGSTRTWTAGETKYYRVNIHSNGGAQTLKRNKVYKLTVRGVTGIGYDTEAEALAGKDNNLSYVINYWDLDDDGLIVYDGTNLLAIPTKSVRLATEGETRSLSIFTFGSGTLAIKSQNYNGSNQISASLSGNTLDIVAQPLGGDPERSGIIDLTFAGLQASIKVVQSPNGDLFLEVITPNGEGIPPFNAGINDPLEGSLTVKASGPWTATLHMEGFSFQKNASVKTLTSVNAPGNSIPLFTDSPNTGTQPREAFILIKLDADPDNFNAVLLLTQKAAGSIAIAPEARTVAFLANRALDLSQGNYSRTQVFNIYPTVDNASVMEWEATLLAGVGSTGDYSDMFEFYNPATMTVGEVQSSTTDVEGNRIGVRPKATNLAPRDFKATLRISLKYEPTVYTDIELIQKAFDLSNNSVPAVSEKGGDSEVINLQTASTDLKWQVGSVKTYTTASPDVLNYNDAVVVDESGTVIDPAGGRTFSITEGFKVRFPKVYYPNRDKSIYAEIILKLGIINDQTGDFEQTGAYVITVEQKALTARPIKPASMRNSYGSIGAGTSAFFCYYYMMNNATVFGPGKTVPLGPVGHPTSHVGTAPVPAGTNYLHANIPDVEYTNATVKHVDDWFQGGNDGVLVIIYDAAASNSMFQNADATLHKLGITRNGTMVGGLAGPSVNVDARTMNTTTAAGTRIGQYLTTRGALPIASSADLKYYADGISAAADITDRVAECKAVPVIGLNNDKLGMFIDPANRLVYMGESQFFNTESPGYTAPAPTTTPRTDKDKFMVNVISYIFYTAAYGSSFSDLLVDGSTLPAPWDAAWTTP